MSEGRRRGLHRESCGDRRVITPARLTAPVPSGFLNTNSFQVCPLQMGGTAPGSSRSGTRGFPPAATDTTGGSRLRLRSASLEPPPWGIPTVSRFSLTRRVTDPGLFLIPSTMAWRLYENLIDGGLDNRISGKVTGWVRFFRRGMDPLTVRLKLKRGISCRPLHSQPQLDFSVRKPAMASSLLMEANGREQASFRLCKHTRQ